MQLIKKHKTVSILIIFFIIMILLYFLRDFIASKNIYTESYLRDEEYIMNPKTYNVNEYSFVNISDEQMATIYLLDFKYIVHSDIVSAYNLLDEEYRNKKFGSLENFQNYINSIEFNNLVSKYYVQKSGNYVVYGVYDTNSNLFIFKTDGVMQYTVYLDEDTVEIW